VADVDRNDSVAAIDVVASAALLPFVFSASLAPSFLAAGRVLTQSGQVLLGVGSRPGSLRERGNSGEALKVRRKGNKVNFWQQ